VEYVAFLGGFLQSRDLRLCATISQRPVFQWPIKHLLEPKLSGTQNHFFGLTLDFKLIDLALRSHPLLHAKLQSCHASLSVMRALLGNGLFRLRI
jgi:hypothetical protein